MDINEAQQIFDSLDDNKKLEVTKLTQYPTLLTSIIKNLSSLIKMGVSLKYSSDFEKKIFQKLQPLCEMLDNTSLIVDVMINHEYEEFLTKLKSENSKKTENTKTIDSPNKTRTFNKVE